MTLEAKEAKKRGIRKTIALGAGAHSSLSLSLKESQSRKTIMNQSKVNFEISPSNKGTKVNQDMFMKFEDQHNCENNTGSEVWGGLAGIILGERNKNLNKLINKVQHFRT